MTGTMAALLPLLSAPGFCGAPDRPQGPRPTRAPTLHGPTLWYNAPATEQRVIQEAMPIGNGRMGALVGGDPARDFLYLTDSSMWLGGPNRELDKDGQFPYDAATFGSFNLLARLYLDVPGHELSHVTEYRRELDLANGYARISYRKDGIRYLREIFASHPDDVVVMHLSQSGGGTWSGAVDLQGTHGESTLPSPSTSGMHFSGTLPNGLAYAAGIKVTVSTGKVSIDDGMLHFAGCEALTILYCGGTNYIPDSARDYLDRAADPLARVMQKLDAAAARNAADLLQTHIADHAALFASMGVNLGTSTPAQRASDTWTRLQARARPGAPADPELEATYLQFGRYLTIAGSRDGLPTNLQGLWLGDNTPAWMSDYHTDINIQMNYWLPDRAGLPSCFEALATYCLSQHESWTAITRQHFNDTRNGFRNSSGKIAGWTVAISTNIFGGNGWWWHPAGNAWLCNSLWQHYQYTLRHDYLARIYPLLKGACEFWEARLLSVPNPDATGKHDQEVLIDDSDWSPEQGPKDAKGITYAQELVWDLFANYRQAAAILGVDAHYSDVIGGMQGKLYLPKISPESGQLEEWMSPKDLGEPGHRHLSPLVGFFPGDRITLEHSPPALIKGVTRLLEARGMTSYGWACAWRALCWARLKDAERAYQLVLDNLSPWEIRGNGTAMNLFDIYQTGPHAGIFQIDANYGTPTAMLDMLLYSRPGVIELLPALPAAWSTSGDVTGIGARNGFVVDMRWQDGIVTHATLHSVGGTKTRLKLGTRIREISLRAGESITIVPDEA
ncbi:glycoside hydrolase family 95 protein [Dyella telluris]|uniref:Glycoside hydrolase family 95 protein n=2 Tax=Dyella telluris TaxID=2763498 RepID=A0A7G8QAW6_9GAMM|nr:glycoside hydrolase family 95 protein [Dyella telluris]